MIYSLYSSQTNVLIDPGINSEHVKDIKCDFKPGSVERCIDLHEWLTG
jgi:hypothetical protein